MIEVFKIMRCLYDINVEKWKFRNATRSGFYTTTRIMLLGLQYICWPLNEDFYYDFHSDCI